MSAPALLKFGPVREAQFIERPNRFRVRCHVNGEGDVDAFMPNPGRLWELLFPGVKLWIAASAETTSGKTRVTQHTVLAVERDGAPVFLHTHVNNEVARALLEQQRVPGLETASIVRSEVTVGRSRFDFLLNQHGRDVYCEVKSCTLFGNGVAMFPDAITARGRRHLLELAELADQGARCVVLFVVHAPGLKYFMPDYHTDLAFSRTLLAVRDRVEIIPLSIGWTEELEMTGTPRRLEIPWSFVDEEAHDRGNYLLVAHFPKPKPVTLSDDSTITLPAGYAITMGHLERDLFKQLDRWRKPNKSDPSPQAALCRAAAHVLPLPICTSRRLEGRIGLSLGKHFKGIACAGVFPLFHSARNPLENPAFHEVLQRFRMRQP